MTLDIHIADSLEVAAYAEPLVSVDFQTHSAFFRTKLSDGCPLIQRMSDYYSDCCILECEIENLITDIDLVCTRLTSTSRYQKWMQDLRDVCLTAMAANRGVYVTCD